MKDLMLYIHPKKQWAKETKSDRNYTCILYCLDYAKISMIEVNVMVTRLVYPTKLYTI